MLRVALIGLALFCYLHILRDYLQIKYGYEHSWLTRLGHVWEAPKYERHGMVVFFIVGTTCLYWAAHAA